MGGRTWRDGLAPTRDYVAVEAPDGWHERFVLEIDGSQRREDNFRRRPGGDLQWYIDEKVVYVVEG